MQAGVAGRAAEEEIEQLIKEVVNLS
jgi:hypothetical protein